MRSTPSLLSLVSCLALTLASTGCPSSPTEPPPDGGTDAGTDAGVPPDVTGQLDMLSLTTAGEVRRPVDLTTTAPKALVEEGGTFVTHEGVGKADGTFVIPNVPAGPYYLSFDPTTFVVTDSREVKLSTNTSIGRPDAATQPADISGATIVFDLDNLHPYQSTDGLTLYSTNLNVARYRLAPSTTPGDTSGTFTYTVRTGQPLIDPAQGDRVLLTQLTSRTAPIEGGGTLSYRSVSRSFEAPEFQSKPGETQTISGTMAEPPALTAPLHWDMAAFRNLAPAIHPRASVAAQVMIVDVQPMPHTYGTISPIPLLVEIGLPPLVDELRTTLTYANPYPASWMPVGTTETAFAVTYQLPGTETPAIIAGSASHSEQFPGFFSGKIAPEFSTVQQPRIEGMDAQQPVTLTTTTPELSWVAPPPVPGERYHYIVFIHELSVEGSATVSQYVGSIRTNDTRTRLPPGLLSSGRSYVFTFDVNTTPDNDILQQVFNLPIPISGVLSLSEIITVQ
ncbi:hypothetical protein [Archangium violaceum]|uniref:hypothetical protein n=1 Tax=Archangium violaceum TaxID=83451 RepID=UPI00126A1B4C|nr:hypothetical protein [Archangium violaceum]